MTHEISKRSDSISSYVEKRIPAEDLREIGIRIALNQPVDGISEFFDDLVTDIDKFVPIGTMIDSVNGKWFGAAYSTQGAILRVAKHITMIRDDKTRVIRGLSFHLMKYNEEVCKVLYFGQCLNGMIRGRHLDRYYLAYSMLQGPDIVDPGQMLFSLAGVDTTVDNHVKDKLIEAVCILDARRTLRNSEPRRAPFWKRWIRSLFLIFKRSFQDVQLDHRSS